MERGDGTMPNPILQVDENMLETKLDRLISEKVGQLPDAMLDAEADEITGAARYGRGGRRRRTGLAITSGI